MSIARIKGQLSSDVLTADATAGFLVGLDEPSPQHVQNHTSAAVVDDAGVANA